MAVDPRYAVLFEPVKIGPVTARNRFYQVPHCNGLGHLRPRAEAAMRAMKAEGGWAVVSNQETEIHPSSDVSPYSEGRLWDERDIPALRLMTDGVHRHGGLAAIELAHNGHHAANMLTRAPSFAPVDMSTDLIFPKQTRAMDKADIRALRHWHRQATRRSIEAGFDIVYVYVGHSLSVAQHFMLPEFNTRIDEYGGSLENRVRLTRELLEDSLEEADGRAAVAFRFAVDEMRGADGMQAAEEGRAVVEMLAEMPDLWDVNVSDWANDSVTTRFQPEDGYQTPYIEFVKQMTSKPVVGVGRFTSPDMMAALVKRGVLDFIGSARPSIADPFLPRKIEENRIDEIRECIGCNICVSSDNQGIPIRCTQNPSMGEEWRRGWHPERIAPKGSESEALVVGAGPAGLECAVQLARRGYRVTVAEAEAEAGGRALRESALPGLAAWRRVIDNRLYELKQRADVSLYLESRLDAAQVEELGVANVFVATGARWRTDGVGRSRRWPLSAPDAMSVLSPDALMRGERPPGGPVLIYDDDQIYLAGVLAEMLARQGAEVILATPAATVSPWTSYTLEQHRIQSGLIALGVRILTGRVLAEIRADGCALACAYDGETVETTCRTVVPVTERIRDTALYDSLKPLAESGSLRTLELVGDAASPGLIADAVYLGRMAAENFESDPAAIEAALFRREIPDLSDTD